MHRFFIDPRQISDETLVITGEEHHHMTRVLRIESEEVFEVCDGSGVDYHCVIESAQKDQAVCRILKKLPSKGEGDIVYTLFQGLPKGTKMDEVVQKTTELGIGTLIPFQSERTVMDLKDKAEKKQQRWQKIAAAAAKQSKRGIIPNVESPVSFDEMANTLNEYDLVILCYEEEKTVTLKSALSQLNFRPKKVACIIGPEGGLAFEEAEKLQSKGAVSVSLGSRILRTETAGPAVLAQLTFFFGEEERG